MRLFARGLRRLIDQETKLLNKMNDGRSVELLTNDQRMAREQAADYERKLWAKEEELSAIKADRDSRLQEARELSEEKDREIAEKDREIAQRGQEIAKRDQEIAVNKKTEKVLKREVKKGQAAAGIYRENTKNRIWFEANASDSVKKSLEYHTSFAKRTWAMFEERAAGKKIVLIGRGDRERFYDRYGKGDEISIDTAGESWASIQEYLECIGTADKVMLLLDKDWKMIAYSLVLMGCDREDIFVYSLMEYEAVERRMLHATWEELKTAARDTQLVLVTANERAGEFIDRFGGEFHVGGVLSAKKQEWGKAFKGFTIVPLKDASTVFPPEKTTLLLCSVNWNEYTNIFSGLGGYEGIYSLRLLSRSPVNKDSPYSQAFANVIGMCGHPPCTSEDRLEKIEQLRGLLADEDSVVTLENLLLFRETGADRYAFIAEDLVEAVDPPYFGRSFLSLSDKEVYVDVGIEDGQSIKDFIRRVHGRYKKIYGWEIVPGYVKKAQKAFRDERIEIVPYGAWDEDVTMHLISAGMASSVSSQGDEEVQCRRIDGVCQEPVTFLKMDIEGAEMRALQGARETIQRYKPTLAISLYHRRDDIWEIPLWLHELVPEYKLYIRHHKTTPNDTVLYAVSR